VPNEARERFPRGYPACKDLSIDVAVNPDELTDEELIQSLAELEAMANAAGIYEVKEPAPRPILTRPT
jgi:hypothetical protein